MRVSTYDQTLSGQKLDNLLRTPLPVVGPPQGGNIYPEAGTYTVTIGDETELLVVAALTGPCYVMLGDEEDDLPSPWPPVANVIDGSAVWMPVAENGTVEIAVQSGETYRIGVPADSVAQAFWF